jgi:hypothetical protein
MSLPSHAGDDTAEVTWPRHDVDTHANKTLGLIYI